MKTKSWGWGITGGALVAFYAVCGLLLLLWPNLALLIADYALATVLCAIGFVMILGYVRGDTLEGMLGYGLAKGLLLALVGVVLFVKPALLITVLPFLWGVTMIAGGFAKLQMGVDLRRISRERWWLMLLGALVSFVLGVFSILQPSFIAYTVTQFAGISLLVEAALDTAAMLTIRREFKHLKVEGGVR